MTELAPTPRRRPHVVIVGSGFGGLHAAKALAGSDVDVTMLDRNNYHGFWPLLYQVATAGLEPESIAYPVRGIVRNYPNVAFEMVEVTGVDFENKQVLNKGEPIAYDYLILAAGSANNYFGNTNLPSQTFGMKDIDEAEALRNHVLSRFEQAVREQDSERLKQLLTFVMIGGGPTGVELAGAFAELIRHVLQKDYPMLHEAQTRVILVEGSPHVLAPFPDSLRQNAAKSLERMGVEVLVGKQVANVENGVISFKDNSEPILADTVVWAAGVRGALLADDLGLELARGFRVKVNSDLSLPTHPEVFVIGDMAYLEGYKPGVAYPMVAQVAMQMGKQAGQNILARVKRQAAKPFKYFDKGQMATIGRSTAVFDAFGIKMTGFLAWAGWLVVHIFYLIGFRNRAVVLASWFYNYITFGGGVRLITGPGNQRMVNEEIEDTSPVPAMPARGVSAD